MSSTPAPIVHTPGPWFAERTSEGEGYVLSVRHHAGGIQPTIAAVWDDNGMGLSEGIANARLIAAAPDLLEALIWAEAAIAPFSREPAEKSGINMIRAAIRKATEQSS